MRIHPFSYQWVLKLFAFLFKILVITKSAEMNILVPVCVWCMQISLSEDVHRKLEMLGGWVCEYSPH